MPLLRQILRSEFVGQVEAEVLADVTTCSHSP